MKEGDSFDMDKLDQLAFRVAYLIAGFLQENLTEKENIELDDWVGASFENQRLFEELTDPDNLDKWLQWKQSLPAAATLQRLNQRLEFTDRPKQKRLLRRVWPYIAAAALIVGAVIAVKWIPRKSNPDRTEATFAKDLAPGSNRARLVLSDGTSILLDSAGKGNLARQGNTQVSKQDSGQINYQSLTVGSGVDAEQMNTLTVPPGGHFKVVLSDGTRVWLNASSSLTYPALFAKEKRSVKLEGEGYFEVVKDPSRPFELTAGGNAVQVLGTHFDVNAYSDEPYLAVTLQEGSVRINDRTILQPGQQAQINMGAAIHVVPADLEKELAWKDGQFVFKQTPLDEVMRQVARWYDCQVQFDANIEEHFNAAVPRDLPVSNLLEFLEGTGRVHFRVEDKKIIVLP